MIIHHGGHGSTLTALAAGTPALIIPTYSERESNARRAAALGVALYLVPETEDGGTQHEPGLEMVPMIGGTERGLDPKLVADAIATLLENPRYADSARAAAQQLGILPGPSGAADVIEAQLEAATGDR